MRDLAYYKALSYTKVVGFIEGVKGKGYWVARYDELQGCSATGETQGEAESKLDLAFEDYIQALLGWGDRIPEPLGDTGVVENYQSHSFFYFGKDPSHTSYSDGGGGVSMRDFHLVAE